MVYLLVTFPLVSTRDSVPRSVILAALTVGNAMMLTMGLIIAGWMAALAPAAAAQAGTAQPCTPPPQPSALAGWQRGGPVTAGMTAADPALLTIGRGVTATLAATNTIRFVRPPAKPGAADRFAGLFTVTVAHAGRYRVALGGGAWIDMVQGDRLLSSVAHAHGPACSPIRKMVDFDLAPGRYLIQIAGSKTRELPLMVAAVPR